MEFVFRRSYRGPIKAVVLDWAGTTVDFGSFAPAAVFVRLFESRGIQISDADARSGMGLMKKDHLRAILARPAVAASWLAVHKAPASEADIDALFTSFVPMQLAVIKEFADPIPGLLDVIAHLRDLGIKIGSTTGYLRSMMDELAPEAARRGYAPDAIVCPDDVPAGRPFPWMCYQNMAQLGVFPQAAGVKVGDTIPDIEEGLNAGMWTVGLSLSGSLVGLSEADVQALTPDQRRAAAGRAAEQLYRAGAHYVIEGIWDFPAVRSDIQDRLLQGEHP